VKKAGDVHPERMTLPLVFFALGEFTLEDLDQNPSADRFGPSVLNAWTHGNLLIVYMLGMTHPEFSSMFQRSETANVSLKIKRSITVRTMPTRAMPRLHALSA
jgi:hypothetical protein